MPSLVPAERQLVPKQLSRSVARSQRAVAYHRATYYGEVLPRVRRLMLAIWRDAIAAEGVERMALSREFRELADFRRCLLGFPSPGRRRDESESKAAARANAPIEESEPLEAEVTNTAQRGDSTSG